MTYEVRWNVPEGDDDQQLGAGGRAEVLQPEPEPMPNPYTIEGQIAQYGTIAMAMKDQRDPVRRWTARSFFVLSIFPFIAGVLLGIVAGIWNLWNMLV